MKNEIYFKPQLYAEKESPDLTPAQEVEKTDGLEDLLVRLKKRVATGPSFDSTSSLFDNLQKEEKGEEPELITPAELLKILDQISTDPEKRRIIASALGSVGMGWENVLEVMDYEEAGRSLNMMLDNWDHPETREQEASKFAEVIADCV